MTEDHATLPLVRAGIDTYRQPVVHMREDCHLCQADGFTAITRIELSVGHNSIVATLNVVTAVAWAGARAPVCVIIHAVFSGSTHADILTAGAARVVTRHSFPHPCNAIPLAAPLAHATRECIAVFDSLAPEGGSLTSTRRTKGKTDE